MNVIIHTRYRVRETGPALGESLAITFPVGDVVTQFAPIVAE